jgi:serine/threonine-protein kinase HipA
MPAVIVRMIHRYYAAVCRARCHRPRAPVRRRHLQLSCRQQRRARQNFSLLYKKQENGNLEIRLSPLYDIVSTAYYPELSRDMAMKLGREYSSEKIMPRDFEPLAEEAGLGKAQVKRRVPEFAKTVTGALAKIEIEHSTTEKVAALIRERCEKALNSFKN